MILGLGHSEVVMKFTQIHDVCWFINPMNTIVISTINHSEIGVICTNLANELGHHLVEKNMERSTMLNRWVNQHFYHFDMGHVQ